jgi:hypothetical protein
MRFTSRHAKPAKKGDHLTAEIIGAISKAGLG